MQLYPASVQSKQKKIQEKYTDQDEEEKELKRDILTVSRIQSPRAWIIN